MSIPFPRYLEVGCSLILCRAYNDMLYLCEKYGPLDSLEKYDPEKDVSITGAYVPFTITQLE